jgi:hypothetical protein
VNWISCWIVQRKGWMLGRQIPMQEKPK